MGVMPGEADLVEGVAGQYPRDEQKRGGDQLGRLRAGNRRGACVFIVRGVGDFGMHILRVRRRVRMRFGRRRILAGQPVARADKRDGTGNDGAKERQEDNGLVHAAQPFIKFTSSTAIEPRLRK
jgi:hypothetical protein